MGWFKRLNENINARAGAASAAPVSSPHHMELEEPFDYHTELEEDPRPAPRLRRMNDSERLGYDAVNLPDHYKVFKLEPVRFCVENGLNFLQSSIIKYVVRYPHKNGVEDLKKAARVLDMAIAFEEGDPDWWRLPGERASRRTYII